MAGLSLQKLPVVLLIVLPSLFWAGNFVIGRALRDAVPPMTLSLFRWSLAFLILLPFVWRVMWQQRALYRRHWLVIAGLALTGVTGFNALVYAGLHYTSASNALLLNSCIPVLIMAIGALFFRVKLLWTQVVGLVVSMTGVAMIILHGSWQALLELSFNKGDVIVFSAMVCWACYTLWMKRLPESVNRLGLLGLLMLITTLLLIPASIAELAAGKKAVWTLPAAGGLLYLGIFPSVLAYLIYNASVARLGAVRAGLSIHLLPAFGVLLAAAFLGEKLHAYHAAGIALIAAGLWLSNRKAAS